MYFRALALALGVAFALLLALQTRAEFARQILLQPASVEDFKTKRAADDPVSDPRGDRSTDYALFDGCHSCAHALLFMLDVSSELFDMASMFADLKQTLRSVALEKQLPPPRIY